MEVLGQLDKWVYIILLLLTGTIWLIFLDNLRFLRKIKESLKDISDFPEISVLIPARNESRNIRQCLQSIVSQDYPSLKEVLVYDDQSTDETTAIVKEFTSRFPFVKLIRGEGIPEGWTGKNFACYTLSKKATGEYLLFVDADLRLKSQALRKTVTLAKNFNIDLLSILPDLILGSYAEHIFVPVMTTAMMSFLPLRLVWESNIPLFTGALGPFMFFKRVSYFKTGGHAAVADEIVEDLRLAYLTKKKNFKVLLIDGADIAEVRFYHGFKEIWNGLSKSAFGAFRYSLKYAILVSLIGILLILYPWYLLISQKIPTLHAVALVSTLPAIRYFCDRKLHYPEHLFIFAHITLLFGLLSLWNSIKLAVFTHGVSWKGRFYPVEYRAS